MDRRRGYINKNERDEEGRRFEGYRSIRIEKEIMINGNWNIKRSIIL